MSATTKKNTKATKATAPKKTTTGEVSIYLAKEKPELDRHAKAAGTTATNLARILIRAGLERLDSGELRITGPDTEVIAIPTTSQPATANAASLARLAKQFKRDPEELAAQIMRAGIQAIDDAEGNNCRFDIDPPYFSAGVADYGINHTYTISGILERMAAEELAELQESADEDGVALQWVIRQLYSRGTNMELLQGS